MDPPGSNSIANAEALSLTFENPMGVLPVHRKTSVAGAHRCDCLTHFSSAAETEGRGDYAEPRFLRAPSPCFTRPTPQTHSTGGSRVTVPR